MWPPSIYSYMIYNEYVKMCPELIGITRKTMWPAGGPPGKFRNNHHEIHFGSIFDSIILAHDTEVFPVD